MFAFLAPWTLVFPRNLRLFTKSVPHYLKPEILVQKGSWELYLSVMCLITIAFLCLCLAIEFSAKYLYICFRGSICTWLKTASLREASLLAPRACTRTTVTQEKHLNRDCLQSKVVVAHVNLYLHWSTTTDGFKTFNFIFNQCLLWGLKNNLNCVSVQSPCAENPCLNDGNCSVVAGEDYSCVCPGGYYGKNCETGTFRKRLENI